ncbi:MAG: YoaK family protein [Sphaerochaetaceae bacterium]|nr:YoaK family protein [Sphaerochaetaceae bacterium]
MGIYFNKGLQTSESFIVGGLLALAGGYLDTYTFFGRGEVFANAQTGNMVLVAINIAQKNYHEIFKYIIPIFSFFLGVVIAEFIKHTKKPLKYHWRQYVLALEMLVIIGVSFIKTGESANIIANSLVSFVCSLQVESFRKMHSTGFATTMCTGNLRTTSENFFHYIVQKDIIYRDKAIRSFSIIILFIVGAIIGTLVTLRFNSIAILGTICILLAAFLFMNKEQL